MKRWLRQSQGLTLWLIANYRWNELRTGWRGLADTTGTSVSSRSVPSGWDGRKQCAPRRCACTAFLPEMPRLHLTMRDRPENQNVRLILQNRRPGPLENVILRVGGASGKQVLTREHKGLTGG